MIRTAAWPRTALPVGVSLVLPIVLYWRALDAGFVGDDFMILHRLRDVHAAGDALRFFRGEFFEYYRPLGFLSHALDWLSAGADARRFHFTNLVLHGINGVLVLSIARVLAQRTDADVRTAGTIAALLFALHPSNHEAVVWVSARFDLLATGWSLAAVLWMVSGARGHRWGPALLFLAAVLSKESAVALPLAAAAWAVFALRSSTRDAIIRVVPWLAVLSIYAVLREAAGGVPATGGAGRLPKLLVFGFALLFLIWCAGERWLRLRDWTLAHIRVLAATASAVILISGLAATLAAPNPATTFVREKLAVAGFAAFYLLTPFTDAQTGAGHLRPPEQIYVTAALACVPLPLLVAWAAPRRLLHADVAWFLIALFVATILPISALMEGRRYLYLPSAIVAIAAGLLVAQLRGRWRAIALAGVAVAVSISALRIVHKLNDWIWAGAMTADGARLVDDALAPACGAGHVVLLTSPVGVRGVYSHFYYETFAFPRGCVPAAFHVVARVVRFDTRVNVEWTGPDTIALTIPDYRGNLVLSADLRHFDLPLNDAVRTRTADTPLGTLRAETDGRSARLTLKPSGGVRATYFYYSEGRIHRLTAAPGP